MELYSLLAIPTGYLLGSIPSSYIIGRLWGKVNILGEGDGHIGATAAYRRVGRVPFIIALIMDVAKGVMAVFIATLLTDYQIIVLASGFAAVAGHCWSVFIKFMGGLGAAVIFGVLAMLNFWAFLIAAGSGIVFLLITRKSSLATVLFIIVMSLVLFIYKENLLLILFPLLLLLLQLIKRWQIRKSGGADNYRNEIFDDLKRIK